MEVVISYVVGIHSVDLITVLGRARAVDRDVLRVAAQSGVVGKIDGCARRQPEDLRKVARG